MKNYLMILGFLLPFLMWSQNPEKTKVSQTIDAWHEAASEADFSAYFNKMAANSVFIGTDASENWTKTEFEAYARPYFDSGKTWSFQSLERNIFFTESGSLAWFNELLSTQMGVCRGSGILTRIDGQWKIKQYVLSISIPNDLVSETVALKKKADEKIIKQYAKDN